MARPRKIDEELVRQAQFAVSNTKDAREFRCAQAVLLPSLMGTTLDQTAALLVESQELQCLACRLDSGCRDCVRIMKHYEG